MHEFRSLRDAITRRTHVRSALALTGFVAWAALRLITIDTLPYPGAVLVPLVVLVATFEIIRPLHAGAERIGRYLQVFVEEAGDTDELPVRAPAWERTAMRFGPAVPGAAGHPLFVPVFVAAVAVDVVAVLPALMVGPGAALLVLPYATFIGWILRADRGMRRQRAADLERYRELRDRK